MKNFWAASSGKLQLISCRVTQAEAEKLGPLWFDKIGGYVEFMPLPDNVWELRFKPDAQAAVEKLLVELDIDKEPGGT